MGWCAGLKERLEVQASRKMGSRDDTPPSWSEEENRLPSSWTVFMMGNGLAWRKWTCHYQTNRQWVLDKHKQDQTLTGHGSSLLVLQRLREVRCGHGNRLKPPGFRFGVNIKSHQGLVSRSFFFFFQTSPQGTTLVLNIFGGLTITADFPWFQALKPTHMKAFRNSFHCNSDCHRISSEKQCCRLQEVTVITHLFSCLLWSPLGVV